MKHTTWIALTLVLLLGIAGVAGATGAVKQFTSDEVTQEQIGQIVEAGVGAPSAMNAQPWHFTVVTNRETAQSIVKDTNGVVIVVSAKPSDQPGIDAMFAAGTATAYLYQKAQQLGLGANIYGSTVQQINQGMKQQLGIPEGYDAAAVVAIGVPAADANTSASERNALSDMVNYVE